MFCQFVDIFVHWNLQQFLVVREERGKLKRKEGEESPHPVQGTQACTWLSCPWSAAWLAQSDLRAVNQTMSLLFVQTPSTSTYIREQVQTGHLTGGTDHQQTRLKTKCQNNLLGIEKCQKSSSVFPVRGWTTQNHAGSNLQIKTTDKHFNHLCPLLPLILENLTRVQVCSHAPLPPSFSHCLVTHRSIKHLYFHCYPPVSLTHCKQSKASGTLFRRIWTGSRTRAGEWRSVTWMFMFTLGRSVGTGLLRSVSSCFSFRNVSSNAEKDKKGIIFLMFHGIMWLLTCIIPEH